MPNGGQNDPPRPGRDHDPRYDWLYGDPNAEDQPRTGGGNDPTQAMPTAGPSGYGQPPPYPGQQPPGQPPYQPPYRPPTQPPGRPPGPPVEPLRPPRRPRRRGIRWGRVLLLLLLAYLLFLVTVPILAWSRVDRVNAEPGSSRPADNPGTTYLVVGSDSREGLSKKEQRELGTGSTAGKRTDTIMLLQVPDVGPPVLVSIPRDSYVPIPGHGSNKVNAAFSFGGPKLLARTLEDVTGLRIDEYVEIGFGGFFGMVEAVGGVEQCLKQPMKDQKAHIDLPKGCQTLDGKNALGYVRARYSDPKGDLGRVERQQKFLAALADKAVSPSTLLNPYRYARFGFATGDALTIDKDTGLFDMVRFGLAMRTVAGGGGSSLTVPVSDPGYDTPVGSAVKWDTEKALELFDAMKGGDPVPADLIPKKGK